MVRKSLLSSASPQTLAQAGERDRRLIRFPEVRRRTGLSKTTAWRGIRRGWFPKPVRLSPGCVAWVEDELDAWIEARLAARDRERLL